MSNSFLRLLTHRYRGTPVAPGTEDAWGNAPEVPGTPSAARPCWLQRSTVLRTDTGGRVQVDTPTLLVAPTDPLAPDDIVGTITTRDGAVLLAGPNTVETVEPLTLLRGVLLRRATFRGAVVR